MSYTIMNQEEEMDLEVKEAPRHRTLERELQNHHHNNPVTEFFLAGAKLCAKCFVSVI